MSEKREIYLDNSATTRPAPEVIRRMEEVLTGEYGNPSSLHSRGFSAERVVTESSEKIASLLHVQPSEILFTSGGTESNNLALIGTARARNRAGRHIITTQAEHPSVAETCIWLEKEGFEITRLPLDETGQIRPDDLENAVRDDTILVSVMMVNNELGTCYPIERIGAWLKANRPDIVFHCDAVQGFGKLEIRLKACGTDLLSVSGHKFHGPKGTGFLYIREGTRIEPILFGGGQQKGLRSGTENVPGIAGLACAAELVCRSRSEDVKRMSALRDMFREGLAEMDRVAVNGPSGAEAAPHIVSASFTGLRSEVLLHALADRGIYVSAGSACSSHHPGLSAVLKAAGFSRERIESTLRFSLSRETTEQDITETLQVLRETVPFLRRFVRH